MEQKANRIIEEVKKAIVGKDEIVEKVLLAILSGGHVLLEDVPGVGKTTLALSFQKVLGLDYKRIQFTADSVPSDITGFSVYNKNTGGLEYVPGPAMTNILLADEINRASGRTQSALLEVMEEGSMTVDGVTRAVPDPFLVIATQNPSGSAGTQSLPNSQLDRFMVRLHMGYPTAEGLIQLMKDRHHTNPIDSLKTVADRADILNMQKQVEEIFISDEIYVYITDLVEATRNHPMVQLGISPRGALALCRMVKANAYVSGRNYVIPEDVHAVFSDVCAHRMILEAKARIHEVEDTDIIREIAETVPVPDIDRKHVK